MNSRRRVELWISGILVVVCLLLLNVLVWQFRKEPSLRLGGVDLARSISQGEQSPASSYEQHEPCPIEAAGSSTAATEAGLQPPAGSPQHFLESEQAKLTVLLSYPEAGPQAVTPRPPKTVTLEPLSYIKKADGRVEATISLGKRVQVVHEGDIFEVKLRVARISSSAVELVEDSAQAAEPHHLMAEIGRSVAQILADKPRHVPSGPVPEMLSNPGAIRQLAADSAASDSHPSVSQELGYVETSDGRVQAIVAEGEQVRLAPRDKSFASSFRPPVPSPANLEVANASPPPPNLPDSLALESKSFQTNSFAQKAGGPPLIALGSEPSTVDKPPGLRASDGESELEPPGIVQPEPLADYSASGAGENVPRTLLPALPAVEPTPPSGRSGNQSAARTVGYVEKAGGEKEAIVEMLGNVYLVHEGESSAEMHRPLQVIASSSAAQAMHVPSTTQARPEILGFGVAGAIQEFFGVQVGAFRDRGNAERLKERIESKFGPVDIQGFKRGDDLLYRVRVGHENTEDSARALAKSLRTANLATETFIVRLK